MVAAGTKVFRDRILSVIASTPAELLKQIEIDLICCDTIESILDEFILIQSNPNEEGEGHDPMYRAFPFSPPQLNSNVGYDT
jgi:hypothetical protein|eukprot:scaffold1958_cov198-Alexandrium_tamarense.AAC.21